MRVSKEKMSRVLEDRIVKTFIELLYDLKDKKEMETFLRDFLSEEELLIYAKRLGVVYWLTKKRSYKNIINNLKVSSATIGTVKDILNRKGIKLALKQIEADEWATKWSGRIKKILK